MKQADPLARPTGMDLPLRLGLSALAYFSTQVLAFQFPDSFGLVAAIWPAAGVALAALLLSPRRHWPALLGCLFAAGMAANLTTTRPLLASVGFMVANIGETAASAWLITRLGGDHIRFARVREVLALISAVIVVNAATALIGAGTAHLDIGKEFWTFYATWWVADGLGLLLVTPLIVVWAGSWPPLASLSWGRRLEAAVMLALGSAVTWIIFGWERVPLVFDLRPYLLFGFIFWAALRYGLRGTTMLLAAVSVIAIGYTAAGLGHFPLGGADAPLRLLAVQMFLGMMGMTGLLLAAALAERRDAQLRLNESEDQYRTLFESAADAIFIHDAAGQILVVNRRAGELYGYPLAELRSLSIAQVDTPEEAVHMPARIARLMTEGSHQFATHHRRKDGTTLAVEVNARRIVWQGQSAMMSICRDVTERRQAEERLQASEQRHRNLFDQANEGLFLMTPEGHITEVNQALAKMHGYTVEEMKNMDLQVLDVIPMADRADLLRRIQAGEVVRFEVEHYHKDGHRFPLAVTTSLINLGGQPFYLAFHQDITERRRAEAELRESETKFRLLAENIQDVFWISTPAIDRILYVSPAFERIWGRTRASLYQHPQSFAEAIHTDDRDRVNAALQEHAQGNWNVEYRILRPDGSVRWIHDRGYPIRDENGALNLMCGVAADITARRQAEAALRESHGMIVKLTSQVPGVVYQYRLYPDGRSAFPFASPGMNDIYEVTPEAVREDATPVFGRLHPEDYDRIVADIQESARTLQPFHCEFRVVLPRQGLRWRLSDASPERMEDGGTLWHGIISDITERRQAEVALRERFKELACLYSISTLIASPGTSLDETLDETVRLIPPGWQFPEVTAARLVIGGRTFQTPGFRETTARQAQEVLVAGRPVGQLEVCYLEERPASQEGPFLAEERALLNAIAERVGLLVEHQQAEAALRESTELTRQLLQTTDQGIYGINLDGGCTFVNRAGLQALGYQLEECLGKNMHELIHHQFPDGSPYPVAECPIFRSKLTGIGCRVDNEVLWRKDGSSFPAEYSSYPVLENGEIRGAVVTFADITERRQTEAAQHQSRTAALNLMRDAVAARERTEQMSQALRASEASYRMLFREMQNGFAHSEIICDAQGRPINSRYLAVNPAFERITGRPAEAVVGKTILEVFPALEPSWIETFGRVALTGEPAHFEMSAAALGITLEVSAFRPAPNQYACTFTDITERLRLAQERAALDAQVRQQQKLEAIGTLASGVAHEINNPINGAMNYAQLIFDAAVPGSRTAEFAREILHETERVAIIVRNLLRFARQDSESHSLANVTDIIEGTLSLLRTVIRRDQITFTLDVPADLPALKCRSLQIQQVLMNLMTNARDALNERYPSSDPDKVLHLTASLIQKAERPWIRITVEDHGTGITPAVRQRMFDPFFTTKPRDQGTGLGLAISHGLVKEHHGELTVESEPGKFTRMHVDLPVDNEWKL